MADTNGSNIANFANDLGNGSTPGMTPQEHKELVESLREKHGVDPLGPSGVNQPLILQHTEPGTTLDWEGGIPLTPQALPEIGLDYVRYGEPVPEIGLDSVHYSGGVGAPVLESVDPIQQRVTFDFLYQVDFQGQGPF